MMLLVLLLFFIASSVSTPSSSSTTTTTSTSNTSKDDNHVCICDNEMPHIDQYDSKGRKIIHIAVLDRFLTSAWGWDLLVALDLAREEAQRTMLADYALHLVAADIATNPVDAIQAAIDVTSTPILARVLLGPLSSADTIIISPISNIVNVPMIGYGATSPALSDDREFPKYSRVVSSDAGQATAMAALMLKFGWRRAAMISSDDRYGHGLSRLVDAQFPRIGLEISTSVTIAPTDDLDSIAIIFKQWLQVSRINVVILITLAQTADLIFKAAAKVGLLNGTLEAWQNGSSYSGALPPPQWILSDSIAFLPSIIRQTGLEASLFTGMLGIFPHLPSSKEFMKDFLPRWRERRERGIADMRFISPASQHHWYDVNDTEHFGKQPILMDTIPDGDSSGNGTHTHDAELVNNDGHVQPHNATAYSVNFVYRNPESDLYGETNATSFNPFAAYAYDALMAVCRSLHTLDVAGIDLSLPIQELTDSIVSNLRNTSFMGLTGHVSFDSQGDRPPSYDIVNFRPAFRDAEATESLDQVASRANNNTIFHTIVVGEYTLDSVPLQVRQDLLNLSRPVIINDYLVPLHFSPYSRVVFSTGSLVAPDYEGHGSNETSNSNDNRIEVTENGNTVLTIVLVLVLAVALCAFVVIFLFYTRNWWRKRLRESYLMSRKVEGLPWWNDVFLVTLLLFKHDRRLGSAAAATAAAAAAGRRRSSVVAVSTDDVDNNDGSNVGSDKRTYVTVKFDEFMYEPSDRIAYVKRMNQSSLAVLKEAQVHVNNLYVTFGLDDEERLPIDKQLTDTIEIINQSRKSIYFLVLFPHMLDDESYFVFHLQPGRGVVEKESNALLDVVFQLHLTTSFERYAKLIIFFDKRSYDVYLDEFETKRIGFRPQGQQQTGFSVMNNGGGSDDALVNVGGGGHVNEKDKDKDKAEDDDDDDDDDDDASSTSSSSTVNLEQQEDCHCDECRAKQRHHHHHHSRVTLFIPLRYEAEISTKLDPEDLDLSARPLGEGAFGAVYRGMYRFQQCAIKVLKHQQALLPEAKEEFRREVELFECVRCPYIVTFIGASYVPSKLCIVTEYLSKGSVGNLIYKCKVPSLLKYRFLHNAAMAMAYLHSVSILYRDLKPDNLLILDTSLRAPVNVKLIDFGTSRQVENSKAKRRYTMMLGTPIYMAPEIFNHSVYNNACDVYSFAILAYEIYLQSQPWKEERVWDIPKLVVEGHRPQLPQRTPVYFRQIIEQCWQDDVDQRPEFSVVAKKFTRIIKLARKSIRRAKRDNSVVSSMGQGEKPSREVVNGNAKDDDGGGVDDDDDDDDDALDEMNDIEEESDTDANLDSQRIRDALLSSKASSEGVIGGAKSRRLRSTKSTASTAASAASARPSSSSLARSKSLSSNYRRIEKMLDKEERQALERYPITSSSRRSGRALSPAAATAAAAVAASAAASGAGDLTSKRRLSAQLTSIPSSNITRDVHDSNNALKSSGKLKNLFARRGGGGGGGGASSSPAARSKSSHTAPRYHHRLQQNQQLNQNVQSQLRRHSIDSSVAIAQQSLGFIDDSLDNFAASSSRTPSLPRTVKQRSPAQLKATRTSRRARFGDATSARGSRAESSAPSLLQPLARRDSSLARQDALLPRSQSTSELFNENIALPNVSPSTESFMNLLIAEDGRGAYDVPVQLARSPRHKKNLDHDYK